jgi:hypothetical protein
LQFVRTTETFPYIAFSSGLGHSLAADHGHAPDKDMEAWEQANNWTKTWVDKWIDANKKPELLLYVPPGQYTIHMFHPDLNVNPLKLNEPIMRAR